MMDGKKSLTLSAPAKLNLTLDVLGRREDGYHEMRMVMTSVSLADQITLTVEPGEGVVITTDLGFLPVDGRNLAAVAAGRLQEATGADWGRLTVELRKQIPVCAGTAGGSSDAAAVLRGLNRLCGLGLSLSQLARIGERVGSDVPYCVMGGTVLAEGLGEKLTGLPALPKCWAVLIKPGFSVSTPELFAKLDGRRLQGHPDTAGMLEALERGELSGVARRLYNVFEEVLPPRRRALVEELKGELVDRGALGACMTGTGSTVYGLFSSQDQARAASDAMGKVWPETFLTHSL